MANDLQTKLDQIKLDKNTNLLPENLKAGVTCLGVNGTYEGSGGGSSDYNTKIGDNYTNGNLYWFITEISSLNIKDSVTDTSNMFSGFLNLMAIPEFDTPNVTNMSDMFNNCRKITTIPAINTSKATNMERMFYSCTNLIELPQLDTTSVTNMNQMFYDCSSLTIIPLLDTSNVTDMYFTFSGCYNLTTIPQLDTGSVTNMAYMFSGCTSLMTIPQLDTSSVTNMSSMFNRCTSLSDESLNNVLAMCTNATSYTSTKTLAYIGLSEEQATKCTTLSNYSAFTAAGWTTGY